MNKDTQFLLERMDSNHREVMSIVGSNHANVMSKVELIAAGQNKFVGAFSVVTAFVSAIVSFVVAFLTGK